MIFSRVFISLALLLCATGFSPRGLALELPKPERVETPTPASERWVEVVRETKRLRDAKDTEGLEKLATELRESGEQLDGGTWLLSCFYDAAVWVPEEDKDKETAAIEFYRKWARDRPDNITAQVCLAEALVSYAWNARGSGYADTVTDEGWRLMRERLSEAGEVLKGAKKLPEKCPGWYAAAQSVALGQGWDSTAYMKLVTTALALQPTYGEFYTKACYWMLPRWHGEEGDFEKWIAERADAYPEGEKDRQYARFVWMADRMSISSAIVFGDGRLDWERSKRGFHQWLKEMPDNLMVQTEFILLAIDAGDRDTAREQFDKTGGRYYAGSWEDDAQFEKARLFAYEGGPNPFAKRKSESRVAPKVSAEVIEYVKTGVRLTCGFIGGVLSGTCLLIIAARRREVWPGVIAILASIVIGTVFGTISTVLVGAGLWLYLRRRPVSAEMDVPTSRGWVVLLVGLGLIAVYLGLQFGAAIFAMIPALLEQPPVSAQALTEVMMSDGTVFVACRNAAWITLLVLLAICPAQRAGMRLWLGLNRTPLLPAIGWTFAAAVILAILAYGFDQIMDPRSRDAMQMMALGLLTPGPLFLALLVSAPIVEELLFRGYFFSGWISKIGFWGTALLTSFLFSVMHLQYGWVALASVFAMGLVLTALRWKTGSVYPCVALHMILNLLATVGLFYHEK